MTPTSTLTQSILHRPTQLFESYVFDLDGTLYLGDELLPGAAHLIEALRDHGRRVVFCSNNPTRAPQQYADKLTSLGIPAQVSDVITTSMTTVRWLAENASKGKIFVIGEQPLKDSISAAGLELSEDPREIDVVVASYDRGFDYRKLKIAFEALSVYRRAILVSSNPDRFCPLPGGFGDPDAAAVTAAIEASAGVVAVAQMGKPSSFMFETISALTGIDPATTLVVGDRLTTDIAMGVNAGTSTALVLTGESTLDDVDRAEPDGRPTYIVESVDDLLPVRSARSAG
ncbi:HAD-IIA family hydrolase [Rhodococcus sp. IEGM 1401]|uniref:HAD-IIA family hydrolase n=1 Tax=unclassified Rhodococcus (in: high G+C Gram-positive bacteria) TaxID=192944 RepID=UPI0022B3E45D|nr:MULTISPECIES: HAD-IIA family hydrolase [unclassified Rhodococcus (in: high G+C Gram-positive bacteria)]MCZ4564035.1 HAD-IIA family hydrolase [Rhodococcus sp. IEGM 1401]MDI9924177.1 HAD-IIA family hydrolase [Rhodococcus sp. IEGM 1372]MDV8036612.1 HAD-IIA family hydrolase [Rhodococcus sp. IEGM 1414]MDV8079716.1 HAD-IIA family hydrolase [Rhodococcus sp. IEGM 1370]